MSADSPAGPAPDRDTRSSLIARLRAGDPNGWVRLTTLYRSLLCHWAGEFGVPSQDLDDVCQEVYAEVKRQIGAFERGERTGSFRKWLREIARRKCLERFRADGPEGRGAGGSEAAQRLQAVPDRPADDDPADLLAELRRRTMAMVRAEFSDAHWRVFERLVFDRATPAEVAAGERLTEANVRAIKSRILRRLREEEGEVGEGPGPAGGG